MRDSGVFRWLARFGFLLASLGIGGLIGVHYERSCRKQVPDSPIPLAIASADMALAAAEKGDVSQASILIRQAIHRAVRDPDSYSYLWNAVKKAGSQSDNITLAAGWRQDLLVGLDAAMLESESVDNFAKLYNLRSAILARPSPVATKFSAKPSALDHADLTATEASNSKPPHPALHKTDMPSTDLAAMMQAGLKSLVDGDENRAEFLTQAALRSQSDHPELVPGFWKEYKAYLDSETGLKPYDKLARLSAYLDSIDTSLLACRNMMSFTTIWAVREDIAEYRTRSHAELVAEIVGDVMALNATLKKTADAHDPLGTLRLIASHADRLKPKVLIVLATGSDKGQSVKSASDSLRTMLIEAIDIAVREIEALNKRADLAAAIDRKGDSVVPASLENQSGEYEGILRDAGELAAALEAADLHSWIAMVSTGAESQASAEVSREITTRANKKDTALDAKLARLFASLGKLHAEVARLQGVRYNLWALRSIYRAGSTDHSDNVLAQIDVGLLHPTVNVLYSMAYDTLVKNVTDPQVRTRKVQNILNSKKQVLSAF